MLVTLNIKQMQRMLSLRPEVIKLLLGGRAKSAAFLAGKYRS